MAIQRYGTGLSEKPIDFVSGAMAFSQAAADERLKEIEANREQVSDNYKNVLKASSIKLLPELTNKIRDKYQGEIETYRNDIMEKFKKSGGKLSMQEQRDIQDGFTDMQQKMLYSVGGLKQIGELQKKMLDPRYKDVYDQYKVGQIIAEAQERVDKGGDVGSLTADIAQAVIPQSNSDFLFKHFSKDIEGLDIESFGEIKNGVFTFTSGEGEAEVDRKMDEWVQSDFYKRQYTNPDGTEDIAKKNALRNSLKDTVIKSVQKSQKGSTGRVGTDKYKNVVDYTPSKFEYKGSHYNITRVPSTISQTDRNFFIDKARNLDTGKWEKLTQDNAKIGGVDVDKGVILLEGKGGMAQRDGKDLLIRTDRQPSKEDGAWKGDTYSDIKKKDYTDLLKLEYKGDRPIDNIKDISFSQDESGNVTVSGTLVVDKKGLFKGTTDVPVEINYKTFADPSSSAIYEAPLWTNKEAVANMFSRVSIRNRPFETYFDGRQEEDSKTDKNKTPSFDSTKF